MKRRAFVQLGMAAGALVATGTSGAGEATGAPRRAAGVDVVEAGATELAAAMAAGTLTSVQLVKAYQARIRAIDRSGPRINAVIEENPDALALATALDRERRAERAPRAAARDSGAAEGQHRHRRRDADHRRLAGTAGQQAAA